MAENYQEGDKVQIKRSLGSGAGDGGKQWRIVDLAGKEKTGQSGKSDGSSPRKRKKSVPVKQIFNGIINLLLVFGLGMAAYFGWAFYKNNYAGKGIFGTGRDDMEMKEDGSEQDPQKDLQEKVDKVKGLLKTDGETGEATSTQAVVMKNMLRILDNSVGFLNVRSGPSTSDKIIAKVKPGEEYEYISTENNWYNIVLEDGGGWVRGDYVEVLESAESASGEAEAPAVAGSETSAEAETKVKVKETPTGYLNVRSSPWGTIIGKIYPGEEYAYTDTKDNWYFLTITDKDAGVDKSGWVFGDYIEK